MFTVLIALATTVLDLWDEHPDIAKGLIAGMRDLLDGAEESTVRHPGAVAAQIEGLARLRAEAVQSALRRHPNPTQ